ncbi:MAG: alpha/beta hydrolase family protein [Acidimicrobiales bacterium]
MTLNEPPENGLGARKIVTTVRYPAIGVSAGSDVVGATPLVSSGPYPLVIFSPGFDIQPDAYSLLLNAWAGAGYVVAEPTYPFTAPNWPGGVLRTDIVHHPADLSFVITTLEAESDQAGTALSGLINSNEVGVIGQSDGGDVSLAAIANTCCRDGRIKAAVILSGAELNWFRGEYFTAPNVPILVVQGTKDYSMNPVGCSVDLYNEASNPKYYLSMIAQNHLSEYVPPTPAEQVVAQVTIDFLNVYLEHNSPALAEMKRAGTVRGLATISSVATLPRAGGCPESTGP